MKNFKVIPFERTHAIDIVNQNIDDGFINKIDDFLFEWIDMVSKHPAYTVFYDDIAIFAGGVVLFPWGMGDAWLLTQKKAFDYKKTFCSIVMAKLANIILSNDLSRVSMLVEAEDNKAKKFASFLGFNEEGLLKKYGPLKKNYYQFARIV